MAKFQAPYVDPVHVGERTEMSGVLAGEKGPLRPDPEGALAMLSLMVVRGGRRGEPGIRRHRAARDRASRPQNRERCT